MVVLGANMLLTAKEVSQAEQIIKGSKVMCCQLEIPQEITLAALKLGKQCGSIVLL